VSKNVAVFVDVANIFYAAKAAGADIDYVTLLKTAIAGRDFVRAYAYTGLDPENENQRQFHSFLARNGYKVVSKDIRKYGDGRIKANLDIELVVDLMRMARNLDIAVVVSGDGDFAPAIRAVQQMGVRVEVISFRGNTSSDLIDVADGFIDIAQIARVDKDSVRSGRRVAAEGDLSMTEVPEKETEGAPRRRRGRGRDAEREARVAADTASLVALPGERLSRLPEGVEADGEAEAEPVAAAAGATDEEAGDAPRRRRRRGGRGRGRGRRTDDELVGAPAGGGDEEDEDFEEVLPPPPAHQTFGSVWDSQLGVPSAPLAAAPAAEATAGYGEDEDGDEPEIPEYLLAERRQRQHGQRGRMGRGRGGAYQAALDRERFGRTGGGGAPGAMPGFGGGRPDRQRQDRGRGPRPPAGRGERQPTPRPVERQPAPMRSSSDPWSEVPPEMEELLRAELSRKSVRPATPGGAAVAGATSAAAADMTDAADDSAQPAAAVEAKPKRTTRPRMAKATEPTAAAEEKPKRATRSRTTRPTAAEPTAEEATPEDVAPKRTTRTRTTRAAATAAANEPTADAAAGAAETESKPVRRRRTKKEEAAE